MGVRGLTTYITRDAELYLKANELHDTNLVIDGDNFASQIYKWESKCNSAFGGDYDQYYRVVVNIFKMFEQCNINSYVVLDGGYEGKKLKTVRLRLRGKIAAIKKVNPFDSYATFPLMMREVFVDALKFCNVKHMRCLFEADDEIALLAKKLNCPVLSYDSDFYIHNVKYIPISTVTFKVYKRILLDNEKSRIVNAPKTKKKSRRKVLVTKEDDSFTITEEKKIENEDYYYFLDSCLYQMNNLTTGFVKLNEEKLPLLAVLLGNDYIEKSAFRKFFNQITFKKTGKKISVQQKRIYGILKWLENQTLESGILQILGCLKKDDREELKLKIESAMGGYLREDCLSYEYFGFVKKNHQKEIKLNIDINDIKEIDDVAVIKELDDDEERLDISDDDEENEEDETLNIDDIDEINVNDCDLDFPDWFKKRYMNAEFSRCFVDFLSLRIYVNVPQIENFQFPDCNKISEDILKFVYSLMQGENKKSMIYMTRDIRGNHVIYNSLKCIDLNGIVYNPNVDKNFDLFKVIFKEFNDCDEIFDTVNLLPEKLRLYFIAILYWSRKSKYITPIHIHCILLSFLALNVIDKKCGVHRNPLTFDGIYGKLIKELKKVIIPKENFQEIDFNKLTTDLTTDKLNKTYSSITKNETIFIQEKFITHFQLQLKTKTRHSEMVLTILHVFSELQSIIFNINSLNTLCNYPFSNIQVQNLYNGMFLYNMYITLKARTDLYHFIRYYLFENSPNIYNYYFLLLGLIKKHNSNIVLENNCVKKTKNNNNNNRKKKKKQLNIVVVDENINDIAKDDLDNFEDINNKFSILLKL